MKDENLQLLAEMLAGVARNCLGSWETRRQHFVNVPAI